jgi:hypothetical protein
MIVICRPNPYTARTVRAAVIEKNGELGASQGVSVIWTRRSLPGPPEMVKTRFHSRTW